MASKNQLTGMTGVYLVAAELSRRGLIASPTSRSAQGADLLVTDSDCQRSYAVQVKTNARTFNFWLVNPKAGDLHSDILIYAFVNLRKDRTEYYLVPSQFLANNVEMSKHAKSVFHFIRLSKIERFKDNWAVFSGTKRPTRRSTGRGIRRRAG